MNSAFIAVLLGVVSSSYTISVCVKRELHSGKSFQCSNTCVNAQQQNPIKRGGGVVSYEEVGACKKLSKDFPPSSL